MRIGRFLQFIYVVGSLTSVFIHSTRPLDELAKIVGVLSDATPYAQYTWGGTFALNAGQQYLFAPDTKIIDNLGMVIQHLGVDIGPPTDGIYAWTFELGLDNAVTDSVDVGWQMPLHGAVAMRCECPGNPVNFAPVITQVYTQHASDPCQVFLMSKNGNTFEGGLVTIHRLSALL